MNKLLETNDINIGRIKNDVSSSRIRPSAKKRKRELQPCGIKYQGPIHPWHHNNSCHGLQTWRLPSMSSRVVMNLILMSPTMIVRLNLSLKQMRILCQPNQLHRGRENVITAMKFHRNGKYFNVGTQFAHCVLSYWTAEEDPLTANVMSAVSPFRMSFLFSQVSWNSKSEKEHSEWQDETV